MVVAALALTGCSGPDPAPGPATINTPLAESAPALPTCAEVFVPGKPVDEQLARAGCLSARGQVVAVGFFECQDGGILFQVDASTGAPNGYGLGGKPYRVVKGESAANRGYKKAYQACMSADQPTAAGRSEARMSTKPPTAAAVEVTAGPGAGGVVVSVTTPAPVTPTTPGNGPTPVEEVRIPVPGGEWANAPKTPATSTVDPG
jgi:hypothetical protein